MAIQMAASLDKVFKVIEIPQQKLYNGVPFPLVVTPGTAAATRKLPELVRTHKPWLEARLKEAGAVLFRGFHVATADDFSDVVVRGFEYEEFPFKGAGAPRTHVVGPVYTSNDSAPHFSIQFHNEIAYLEENPNKLFFYCEVEPGSEGETPIVLGHVVYERLKKNHSDFLYHLEEHGFLYKKFLPDETDPSSPINQSWKATFSTDDKSIAEQRATKVGLKLEWIENGVKIVGRPVPGIKIDKIVSKGVTREHKMWSNSLMPSHESRDIEIILGDGGSVPPELIQECRTILNEECVAIPWIHGDVLLLDNRAVQHARRPFTPPRRVLAALIK